jgi:hypothetical protein
MGAVLNQHRLEIHKQLLGHLRGVTAALKPYEQLALAGDVPLAQGDMVVHHLNIGGAEGHGSPYHSSGALSRELEFGTAAPIFLQSALTGRARSR